MVAFVDPTIIGAIGCGTVGDRSRALSIRFKNAQPGQIFLLPYNSANHWTLTAVNPDSQMVYHMDPLKRRIAAEEWIEVVDNAIKLYKDKAKKFLKKKIMWENLADILEAFWSNATTKDIALGDGKTKLLITCEIKRTHIIFYATDVNKALQITEMDDTEEHFDREATDDELIMFLDFIHYTTTIDVGHIFKKNIKKEWGSRSFHFTLVDERAVPPSPIIHDVIREISSQRFESEEVAHPMQMEASSPLIEISSLSHQTDIPYTTSHVAIKDASEKLDIEIATSYNSELQTAMASQHAAVKNYLKSTYNEVILKFPKIHSLDIQNASNKKKIIVLDTEVANLKTSQKNLTDSVEKHLAFGLDVSTMIKPLYKNAYGDMIPSIVPVREMVVSDYNILMQKAKEAFDEKFYGPKPPTSSTSQNPEIAALQSEMISLRQASEDLATTVTLMSEKADQNSKDLNHTLQALQAQLALLASPHSESDNKPKGEKKAVSKRVTRASNSKSKKSKAVVTESEAKKLVEEEKETGSVQVEEKVESVQAESVNIKTLDHELLVTYNVPDLIKDATQEDAIKFKGVLTL
ncbi:hypothetical protein POM88_036384 [Heracleum sosnowskyi]|uniref:Ubiquitin-like protease family profile domain-containing protein n=1 Tax=Heracleum sosnowskyi TaxID=360622 RepID=A0AAD8MET8_9APIA|nr:hypothetical protein POM88_036384 [Heracleum sosnowskyi]